MANKQTICRALIILLLGWTVIVQAENRFSTQHQLQDVQLAVENSRATWLMMFPDDDLLSFGFSSRAELNAAKTGAPITVFAMFNAGNRQQIENTGEFLIPLLSNGVAKAFLTVAYFEGKYQVVSAGEMMLAADASPFIGRLKNAIWLRNLDYNADFIASYEQNDADMKFEPLFTAKRAYVNTQKTITELTTHFTEISIH